MTTDYTWDAAGALPVVIDDETLRYVYGLDQIWNGLQRTRVFLIPIVRAVHQEAGYSDIWEEYVQTEF